MQLSDIYFKKEISRLEFIHKSVQAAGNLKHVIMNYGFVSSGKTRLLGYMLADLKYLRFFF